MSGSTSGSRGDGLEVVYIGAIETEEACTAWKEEYGLEFPVISDGDGTLFRALTNGRVPWSVLVGPDGKVVFSENEFDELLVSPTRSSRWSSAPAATTPAVRRIAGPVGCTVVLGGGTGGLVAARELRDRLRRADHRMRSGPPGTRARLPAINAVADGGRRLAEPVQQTAASGCNGRESSS